MTPASGPWPWAPGRQVPLPSLCWAPHAAQGRLAALAPLKPQAPGDTPGKVGQPRGQRAAGRGPQQAVAPETPRDVGFSLQAVAPGTPPGRGTRLHREGAQQAVAPGTPPGRGTRLHRLGVRGCHVSVNGDQDWREGPGGWRGDPLEQKRLCEQGPLRERTAARLGSAGGSLGLRTPAGSREPGAGSSSSSELAAPPRGGN